MIGVFSYLNHFPVLLSWSVPSKCLLVFKARIKGPGGGRKVGREYLCALLGMSQRGKKTAFFFIRNADN